MFKRFTRSKTFPLILVLILVSVLFTLIKPIFISGGNLVNIANSATVSGIIMVGIICLLISGNMDLSTSSVAIFSSVVMAYASSAGAPWPLALLAGLGTGACCGAINAFLAYGCGIFPFIGTLAMGSVWSGLCNLITNAQSISFTDDTLWWLGNGTVLGIPAGYLLMVLLLVIYGLILSKTMFGRTIYMLGGNRQAARLAGLSIKKTGTILMINCGCMSALAGCVLACRMHNAIPATTLPMDAITSAVLGGVAFGGGAGSTLGGFFGLMLLTTFTNGLQVVGLDAYWRTVASGVLLVLALTLDYFNNKNIARQLETRAA